MGHFVRMPEAQKPKTFRIAAVLRAKIFGTNCADTPLATCQETRKHLSRHIKKARNPLSRQINTF